MLENFDGDTFVAFVDISGFKAAMKKEDKKFAVKILDNFYQNGYNILQNIPEINSAFISDCGILYLNARDNSDEENLIILLKAIEKMNIKMLEKGVMLTTSIAFGHFKYTNKIEFEGTIKNPIYGHAYLNTVIDSEFKTRPKLKPGQCRIIKDENLPPIINNLIHNGYFKFLKRRKYDTTHYYFYWMLKDDAKIDLFEEEYVKVYNNRHKYGYEPIKKLLYNFNKNIVD